MGKNKYIKQEKHVTCIAKAKRELYEVILKQIGKLIIKNNKK